MSDREAQAEFERTRELILERRNRFMAAALAGIGMAAVGGCRPASVCLEAPAEISGGGINGGGISGSGISGGGAAGTPPGVCLSMPGPTILCSDGGVPPCVPPEPKPISREDGGYDDGDAGVP